MTASARPTDRGPQQTERQRSRNTCYLAAAPGSPTTPHDICWYLEHLVSTTISNHLSSIRTYFATAGIDKTPLYAPVVVNALRAIAINLRHTPNPAASITPEVVAAALCHIHDLDYPHQVRLAIVWMFMAFLRQSNIAPRTTYAFDPTRHVTRGDIKMDHDSITISLKWSKSTQKSQTPTTVTVWAKPDSSLCPVRAYHMLIKVSPTVARAQPLLQYKDGHPMTTSYISKSWAHLLHLAGLPLQQHTLHGLRRGGASYSYHTAGATLEDVMTHGKWASSAVRAYLKPQRKQKTTVHKALAKILKVWLVNNDLFTVIHIMLSTKNNQGYKCLFTHRLIQS